jgi:hypothetical protein
MQSGSNPTLDANAAHPPEIRKDDPRHLGNLTKKMNSLNSQVSADTKYDPAPPPRVDKDGNPVTETFVSPVPASDQKIYAEYFYALGGLSLIILVAIIVCVVDPRLRSSTFKNKWASIGIIVTATFCTLTILISYFSHRQIMSDLWYPRYN